MTPLLLLLLGCNGCAPGEALLDSRLGGKPDVVLVVIDNLRPDHLGLYGYPRQTSPRLDAWAEGALVFDAAYAHAPYTRASLATLLTSTLPRVHGLEVPGPAPDKGTPPLQVVMSRQGYATAAVVSSVELRPRGNPFAGGFQTLREVVDEEAAKRGEDVTSRRVSEAAIELWTAHHAADDPAPLLLVAYYDDPSPRFAMHAGYEHGKEIPDRYDSEIAFTDAQLGRLLEVVGRDALVVVTSTHGLAFGEHELGPEATGLYEPNLRVPLIVKLPGLQGGRQKKAAGLIDLAPSIVDWAGLAQPKHFDGRPWKVSTFGEVDVEKRPVVVEVKHRADAHGVIDGRIKLIEDRATGKVELYDLGQDPGEKADLSKDPSYRKDLERARAALQRAD